MHVTLDTISIYPLYYMLRFKVQNSKIFLENTKDNNCNLQQELKSYSITNKHNLLQKWREGGTQGLTS